MNEYFNKINNTLFKNLKGNEILKTSVWGENSQFIRVNGAKVRQTGIVNDLTSVSYTHLTLPTIYSV